MVFPEGVKGTGKPFAERYRLQRFGRGGFVEVALRTGSPIVPVAVVGSEEIYPKIADSSLAGAPDRRALRPDHPDIPVARAARARSRCPRSGGSSSASRSTSRRSRSRGGRRPPARLRDLRAGPRDDPAEALREPRQARLRVRLSRGSVLCKGSLQDVHRRADLAQRGLAPIRGPGFDPEALGEREDRRARGRRVDRGRGGPGADRRPDARARPHPARDPRRRPRRSPRLRLRRGPAAGADAEPLPRRCGGDRRHRGGPDRAGDGAARHADGPGGPDQRRGRHRARADGGRAPQRLPADRAAPARPRLRAGGPQDRRGRGAAVPPVRPRADDPRRRAAARDGREHGADGLGAAADRLARARVHPRPLPALLHGAGRRRPHGGRPAADPSRIPIASRWRSASST